MPMGSLIEELQRREAAARQEVDEPKLKRLVERGWLAEDAPGLFTLPRRDAQDASYTDASSEPH
jgi:hypothetical protein